MNSVVTNLPIYTQERIKLLQGNIGKTLGEIALIEPNDERDVELEISTGKKKGSAGVWMEWFLAGERGDNKSDADIGGIEIKCVRFNYNKRKNDYAAKEWFRLSAIHYDKIQTTNFEDSGLYRKATMLVAIISFEGRGKAGKHSKFLGFAELDLHKYTEQIKEDYLHIQNQCKEGRAHEFCSAQNQPGRELIKTYSSDARKQLHSYTAEDGTICEAKGYAMYINKNQLEDVLDWL